MVWSVSCRSFQLCSPVWLPASWALFPILPLPAWLDGCWLAGVRSAEGRSVVSTAPGVVHRSLRCPMVIVFCGGSFILPSPPVQPQGVNVAIFFAELRCVGLFCRGWLCCIVPCAMLGLSCLFTMFFPSPWLLWLGVGCVRPLSAMWMWALCCWFQ